ncbi:MAG: FtsX-like permease family protein [Steroidobacteraceae bacterium]|jgi:putative ABC transport system permease protein|nr:FtsX-like permease family protein [Steroidobacteraceae bacterium]
MSATGTVLRAVALARLREQPLRLLATVAAISLGVALATAVFLINAGALNEFGLAARKLVGEADLIVRGSRAGFDESVFVELAGQPGVREASPALELEVAPLGETSALRVLAIDPFRAAWVQPELVAGLAPRLLDLLEPDTIVLSAAAARELGLGAGDRLELRAGTSEYVLKVLDVMPEAAYPQRLGVMDIATAQAAFGRLGLVNRVDLRLEPGADRERLRERLAELLPDGVSAQTPDVERNRAAEVTRAYRVNLNMLAMVALLTGAFLVFSTQALAVLRRRTSLGLMRALGATRGQVELALTAEGAALGAAGAITGVLLGQLIASVALAKLGGDLGGGYFEASSLAAKPQPGILAAFFLIGTAVAALGAWAPARDAARVEPARALKAGDAERAMDRVRPAWPGLLLFGAGAVAAWLPPVGGLPLFGYASVALLLLGGLLLVPAFAARVLALLPRPRKVALGTAVAQLKGSAGLAGVSLAAIIVSFSLMVAMAIMVYSFRESFEHWLNEVLPADVHLRVGSASDTANWSSGDQAIIAATEGVARVRFQRQQPVLFDPARPPVALLAREVGEDGEGLPLVRGADARLPDGAAQAWISEAMVDLHGLEVGETFDLPLAGKTWRMAVAGVWRDYGHTAGAIVVDRAWYIAATGDAAASEGAIWLAPGADVETVIARIRSRFERGETLQVASGSAVKEISMQIFDRAFAVTYLLEAVAVAIGLAGVAFAFSSQALARRAEFGMLRHVGMLRRQVIAMLAGEGAMLGALGVAYGLALGGVLSLVLVYVINRQSFNWSIDLAVPWLQLGALAALLVSAAAVTAMASGRAATSDSAVRAVREDW